MQMPVRIEMRNKMCIDVDAYCRKMYGPRSYGGGPEYEIRQRMAKEFSAEYFCDSAIMCDVMIFEVEEDYLMFRLKVTLGNEK